MHDELNAAQIIFAARCLAKGIPLHTISEWTSQLDAAHPAILDAFFKKEVRPNIALPPLTGGQYLSDLTHGDPLYMSVPQLERLLQKIHSFTRAQMELPMEHLLLQAWFHADPSLYEKLCDHVGIPTLERRKERIRRALWHGPLSAEQRRLVKQLYSPSGTSRAALARKMGKCRATISRWEKKALAMLIQAPHGLDKDDLRWYYRHVERPLNVPPATTMFIPDETDSDLSEA